MMRRHCAAAEAPAKGFNKQPPQFSVARGETASSQLMGAAGGFRDKNPAGWKSPHDPCYGTVKALNVSYRVTSQPAEFTGADPERVDRLEQE